MADLNEILKLPPKERAKKLNELMESDEEELNRIKTELKQAQHDMKQEEISNIIQEEIDDKFNKEILQNLVKKANENKEEELEEAVREEARENIEEEISNIDFSNNDYNIPNTYQNTGTYSNTQNYEDTGYPDEGTYERTYTQTYERTYDASEIEKDEDLMTESEKVVKKYRR